MINTTIFKKLQRFFHFYSQKLMNTLIFKRGDTPRHMCVNMSRKGSVGLFQKFFSRISEIQFEKELSVII